MANKYVISEEKLTTLADTIREKTGTDEPMSISEMVEAIRTGGGSVQVDLLFEGDEITSYNAYPLEFDIDISPYDYIMFCCDFVDGYGVTHKGRMLFNMNEVKSMKKGDLLSGSLTSTTYFISKDTDDDYFYVPLKVYTHTGDSTRIQKIYGIKGDLGGI